MCGKEYEFEPNLTFPPDCECGCYIFQLVGDIYEDEKIFYIGW